MARNTKPALIAVRSRWDTFNLEIGKVYHALAENNHCLTVLIPKNGKTLRKVMPRHCFTPCNPERSHLFDGSAPQEAA